MKTNFSTRILMMALALATVFSTASCDKEDDHDHEGHGHMHVHFNNLFGANQELQYDSIHTTGNGRNYTISLSQYYISNVRLVNHDGEEVPFDGTYLLAKTGVENELELDDVPAGHYTGIKFNVGVDSTTNHADPSLQSSSSPLALQTPSMHWSWNSGYIFFRLEGMVDTTGTPDGTVDDMYYYHLGTDAYLLEVSLPIDAQVTADNHPGLNINLDHAALFNGIDVGGADRGGHGISSNADLAGRFSTNIVGAFSVE